MFNCGQRTALSSSECFRATDWDVFFDSSASDQNVLTDTITSYIKFCEDTVIHSKAVRIFPNNKPWISKGLKQCLAEKNVALLQGDKHRL